MKMEHQQSIRGLAVYPLHKCAQLDASIRSLDSISQVSFCQGPQFKQLVNTYYLLHLLLDNMYQAHIHHTW